jgi:hypothetical protein
VHFREILSGYFLFSCFDWSIFVTQLVAKHMKEIIVTKVVVIDINQRKVFFGSVFFFGAIFEILPHNDTDKVDRTFVTSQLSLEFFSEQREALIHLEERSRAAIIPSKIRVSVVKFHHETNGEKYKMASIWNSVIRRFRF